MAYIARTPEVHEGKWVGESKECVAFVKHAAHAPWTRAWKKGERVVGNLSIQAGTAIACGWDAHGNYPSNPTGNHAAIYIGQVGDQIEVWDQSRDMPVARRTKFHKEDRAYHVIE
ncbi:BPSL0067 family protein [Chondromyces crocatus]|uniref:BPSL0067 family protein n=1 Tax=Chondromyces crocatus TaxID=52 RepID=A0A0K1E9Z1_CHOCO|nr:BPSL0067 family protein [Chondromyces crocatus]AKT37680.1 uncharacterized protein CMC5_018220 [Chondromyces crocatus]